MPVLGLGLAISGLAFLGVVGLSWSAGFPVEVALVRGLIAFMAVNFLAYLGELVVATAPPAPAEDAAPTAASTNEDERDHDRGREGGREAAAEPGPAAGAETGREPIPLRAEREERRAA